MNQRLKTHIQHLDSFRIGDRVKLRSVRSPLTVIDFQPPALLILESARGHQLKADWRAVEPVEASEESSGTHGPNDRAALRK